MNKNLSLNNRILSAWRSKAPGYAEFNVLLNLFDDPILLYDRARGIILSGNSQLYQLTAYTQAEVVGAGLDALMEGISPTDLFDNRRHEARLARHNREPAEVIYTAVPLENNTQWVVIQITTQEIYRLRQAHVEWQAHLLRSLYNLSTISARSDLATALDATIVVARELLQTPLVVVYQADGEYPQLKKAASTEPPDEAIFPELLSSADLIRLNEVTTWSVGKRVVSDVQRAARIANFNYLVSVPLGQPGALSGLLVAGDRAPSPVEELPALMELLAASLTTTMQHYVRRENDRAMIERLAREEAILKAVYENSEQGVLVLDCGLNVTRLNQQAEFILGYTEAEMKDQPVETFLIGADALSTALAAVRTGAPTYPAGTIRLVRRNGDFFPADVNIAPVQVAGQVDSVLVFIRDMTEDEQMRVRSQHLEQRAALGDVSAVLAHEVRNPINNISAGLQVMALNNPEDAGYQEKVGKLQSELARLTGLIESILSFSRPMKMEPFDLCDLTNRIVQRWNSRLVRFKIEPITTFEPQSVFINGDPSKIEQVMTNLINNAVQAMSAINGGILAVKVARVESVPGQPKAEISVGDNGPGIPEEIREHLFEPFVSNKTGGTGLGLAISQSIITAHRGSIRVSSYPGATVFTIQLPAVTSEEQS